jgi:hypothetical protein
MNEANLKKQSETDWARIDQMTDEEIDTSDIPPLDDEFFARARWRMPEKNLLGDPIQELLAPRIAKNCLPQLLNGYSIDAAREAMVQVELALKEKGKIEVADKLFGVTLIRKLFEGTHGVRLRVPLGEDEQVHAQKYFDGVFTYYRNYTAHDGRTIDAKVALRVLIIASELLELLDASELTLADSGGVEGLLRIGGFKSPEHLGTLLTLLNDYVMPAGTYDGLYEDLVKSGFEETDIEKLVDLDLIEMHSGEFETPTGHQFSSETEAMEWFEVTERGLKALESIEAKANQMSTESYPGGDVARP